MDFPSAIKTNARRVQPIITSTEQAIRFIDRELLPDVKKRPRWTFARALLVVAEKSSKSRDLKHAFRQFRQALSNDRLLKE
jgi:hypothetical protein